MQNRVQSDMKMVNANVIWWVWKWRLADGKLPAVRWNRAGLYLRRNARVFRVRVTPPSLVTAWNNATTRPLIASELPLIICHRICQGVEPWRAAILLCRPRNRSGKSILRGGTTSSPGHRVNVVLLLSARIYLFLFRLLFAVFLSARLDLLEAAVAGILLAWCDCSLEKIKRDEDPRSEDFIRLYFAPGLFSEIGVFYFVRQLLVDF